ncbi:hypothetical protein B0A48_09774 [Cryoendolithus antarcticus]|uniref:Nucleolar pre-ribosomal-associated protein 1 N-terminal domain-containing protein n=1 Tax=Cryoendolithus antarcticus TaxID=1507870 RepID=A0A1V8T346_9PEZI|nr:hypothetical protein B0A48_09774 [Cryoendolithus antarcticus]
MAKRPHDSGNTDRPPKRAKPDHAPAQPAEEIHFARQLSELLVFRQDGLNQLRHGIASFKVFLESILYHHEINYRGRQLSILREYLDTVKPDGNRPFLAQLWDAWSFANQNNNDYLASSLCAIFTLLLKTLSSLLDLREHGSLLCRTILKHDQLRLVKRCLDAPQHKDFLISPSLRLLTELTSFDGGVFARGVQERKELTFDAETLRKKLGLFKSDQSEEDERRRPAIRTLTVRYILAHLKFQPTAGKIDILKQYRLCSALFSHLRDDPADLVLDILRSSEQHVFKDQELPRSAKAALLAKEHLEKVTDVATRADTSDAVATAALNWLKIVITTPSYGVLRESGWYPPRTTSVNGLLEGGSDMIDLGLDSLDFYDKPGKVQVRNTTLLEWLQTLRPHSDLEERRLTLACFEAAPELVHAYFAEKAMQLDPKLTNTWISYASFTYEVVQLPLHSLGQGEEAEVPDAPPQTNIVLDSLLPSLLDRKVLTRCLHQSSELIKFFAVRILVLSFRKTAKALEQMKEASSSSPHVVLWDEAAQRLHDRFMERCPRIKDVANYFRQLPDDDEHALQREAATRLLQQYYQLSPVHALEESFDVSTALVSALSREDDSDGASDEVTGVRSLELEHLLALAKDSTGMRWFHKQGGLLFSPFVTLLRLHVKEHENRRIRQLIEDVLSVNGIISEPTEQKAASGLDAFIASLLSVDATVWAFVDECLSRASRQAAKYLDQLDELAAALGADLTTSPLLFAVVLEQARHAFDHAEVAGREAVLAWVCKFVNLLDQTREDDLVERAAGTCIQDVLDFSHVDRHELEVSLQLVRQSKEATTQDHDIPPITNGLVHLPFIPPPAEPNDHPELFRWQQKDLDIVIEEGDADALILCLCSQHSNIRRQAVQQLRKLSQSLLTSDLDGREQMYILFGELIETHENFGGEQDLPLPYLVGTFATHSLRVVNDPTHFMYPNINTYMIKDPEWRVSKLPGYWLDNTILAIPDEDDSYWKEIQWVLEWLVDGLRTHSDAELLRRATCNVFERVLALSASPAASEKLVRTKVYELLYRAALVDATTLVTRTGCLAWLDLSDQHIRSALKKHVLERAGTERVREWAGVEVVAG